MGISLSLIIPKLSIDCPKAHFLAFIINKVFHINISFKSLHPPATRRILYFNAIMVTCSAKPSRKLSLPSESGTWS